MLAVLMALAPSLMHAQQKEIHVAAAADLQPAMPALAAAYEHATGVKVITSFGSSATLSQQLSNGDPQDLFLSADFIHPEHLVAAGLADDKAPIPYARGVLVLWARKDSPAQPLSLDSMTKPAVQKIAIANDMHAPYGVAGKQALRSMRLLDTLTPKLVVAENVMQGAQFAESGNAQAAIISQTIADSPHFRELGTFVLFPTVYAPINQCGIVMKSAKNAAGAHDFLRWLTSKDIQENLKKYGLDPVQ
jgi:molybdate transport system substrate-binding protein